MVGPPVRELAAGPVHRGPPGPQPPGADDYAVEANGLNVVMARELLTYLRGSRVEFVETPDGARFDVTFPNQDPAERDAAGKWLRDQTTGTRPRGPTRGSEGWSWTGAA